MDRNLEPVNAWNPLFWGFKTLPNSKNSRLSFCGEVFLQMIAFAVMDKNTFREYLLKIKNRPKKSENVRTEIRANRVYNQPTASNLPLTGAGADRGDDGFATKKMQLRLLCCNTPTHLIS